MVGSKYRRSQGVSGTHGQSRIVTVAYRGTFEELHCTLLSDTREIHTAL